MNNPELEIHIDFLSLYTVYGNACLGLKHPENHGDSRLTALNAIEKIGAYLVDSGCLTNQVRFMHENGLTRWARNYHE